MTASWSPLTNRLVAVGVLILGLLAILNFLILPVAATMRESLDALHDSRFRLARLNVIEARPPLPATPALAPGLAVSGPDRGAALAALVGTVGATAARAQLALEPPAPLPIEAGGPKRLMLRVAASGSEAMMLQFINDLERGAPAIRFKSWHLSVVDGAPGTARQLRFDAIAMAALGGPQ